MASLAGIVRHLGYSIRLLGPVGGIDHILRTALGHAARRPKSATRRLRLRDLTAPITLRPLTSDWNVAVDVFARGDYELPGALHAARLEVHYRAILGRGETPIIVDCGANIGLSALWFAHRFPRAVIWAVEPEPDNFALLEINAAACPAIRPLRAGISDRATRLALANASGAPWAWQTTESPDGAIETVTVADLLARIPGGAPLIVKIDIEGYEVDLFRSATDWAAAVPLVVFEDHDWLFPGRGTFQAVMRRLLDTPRDYLRRGENTWAYSHALLGDRP